MARQILQSLHIRSFEPQVTACPGCGRTTSTFFQEMADDITSYIREMMPVWRREYPGVEEMDVAVMGCVVNGPGESKQANIGISLPGTFEEPKAPVYVDGELRVTLKEGVEPEPVEVRAVPHVVIEAQYLDGKGQPTRGHSGTVFGRMDKVFWHTQARADATGKMVAYVPHGLEQVQLDLMIAREAAFLPRPDSGVWANERQYLNVDGRSALGEFASARIETLKALKELDESIWSRSARHAIFGPTNFLEVTGFMADHDRLHVQQAWKTLKSL